MWFSPSKTAHTGENLRGNDKTQPGKDVLMTDNVDSGFLSGGNMQFSGEIGDSGLHQSRQDVQQRKEEQPLLVASGPGATASAASSAAKELTGAVDSGVVDADLSEVLNDLTLRQAGHSLVADSGGLTRAEPTFLELSRVSAGSTPNRAEGHQDDDILSKQHQRHNDDDEKRTMTNDDFWQLYYKQNEDGDTQLHITIIQGYVQAALILIGLRPHPYLLNVLNDDWQSPLYLAVLTNQPLIVRRLILAGANPSLRNFRGNTALHLACATGNFACARALTDPLYPMERNKLMPGQEVPALPQNLEQRNYNGEMCLHVAAANGHVNLMRLLLRLGADLEAREALAGKTALHLAMERGRRSVITFLLQECKPCMDTRTYSGLTAYQLALCIDIQLARELLRYGANPEPLPESDSEDNSTNDSDSSDDEAYKESDYLSPFVKIQNTVGVRV